MASSIIFVFQKTSSCFIADLQHLESEAKYMTVSTRILPYKTFSSSYFVGLDNTTIYMLRQ